MAHQVPWNKPIVDEFIRLATLSEIEEKVLITRAKGWTRTQQCMEFHLTMPTLDRIIKTLKRKYDDCQKYSDILPPRKQSAEELYMDTH